MATINDIQENYLSDVCYYDKLDWNQFLMLAKQAYLKLDAALNKSAAAKYNSGRYIDAQVEIKQWNEITLKMDEYVRTKVPYWMADEFHEYIEEVLDNA